MSSVILEAHDLTKEYRHTVAFLLHFRYKNS